MDDFDKNNFSNSKTQFFELCYLNLHDLCTLKKQHIQFKIVFLKIRLFLILYFFMLLFFLQSKVYYKIFQIHA